MIGKEFFNIGINSMNVRYYIYQIDGLVCYIIFFQLLWMLYNILYDEGIEFCREVYGIGK